MGQPLGIKGRDCYTIRAELKDLLCFMKQFHVIICRSVMLMRVDLPKDDEMADVKLVFRASTAAVGYDVSHGGSLMLVP